MQKKSFDEILLDPHQDVGRLLEALRLAYNYSAGEEAVMEAYLRLENAVSLIGYELGVKVRRDFPQKPANSQRNR